MRRPSCPLCGDYHGAVRHEAKPVAAPAPVSNEPVSYTPEGIPVNAAGIPRYAPEAWERIKRREAARQGLPVPPPPPVAPPAVAPVVEAPKTVEVAAEPVTPPPPPPPTVPLIGAAEAARRARYAAAATKAAPVAEPKIEPVYEAPKVIEEAPKVEEEPKETKVEIHKVEEDRRPGKRRR